MKKNKIIDIRKLFLNVSLLFGKSFRNNIIRRSVCIDESRVRNISFSIARSGKDLRDAYRLIYNVYLDVKYVKPNKYRLYFNEKNMAPNSITSIGKCNGEVISSLSAFFDSEYGLPSDYLSSKIDDLRKNNKKIVELGSLVTRKDFRGTNHNMLFYNLREIISYIFSLHKKGKADCIICSVLEEHAIFYEALFGFKRFGEGVFDVDFQKAILLILELDGVEDFFVNKYSGMKKSQNLYEFFLKNMKNTSMGGSWNKKVYNYFLKNNLLSSKLKDVGMKIWS